MAVNLFKTIRRFEATTSTNDEAILRARGGAPEGEVFVADLQTAGRGRLGRAWETPPGKNLAISFLIRPSVPAAEAPHLSLVAGVAVHETLLGLPGTSFANKLTIKWPNDVLLSGKKVAGTLSETETKGNQVVWVVVGVGINVNADETDFSSDVRKIATSLKIATGRSFDREALLASLLKTFERHYLEFCIAARNMGASP